MYRIERYDALRHKEAWNSFVEKSKNGTFLFDRNYMDYHQSRFTDHSLMCYFKGKLYAILPANEAGNTIISHQGLSYGGLIMDENATSEAVIGVFRHINDYYREQGFRHVTYRPTPCIFHSLPSEEDLYAIVNLCRGQLTTKEISTTIVIANQQKWTTLRTRCVRKAMKNEVTVRLTDDMESFWDILSANLHNKYKAEPVHTLSEIRLLQSRFPGNILLMGAFLHGEMIGGMLLYCTKQVVHAQYISANDTGKKLGAIDLIVQSIVRHPQFAQPYFDLGKSTQENGTVLNGKLIHQKEGFGGRAICYDTYEWDL